MKRVFLLLLGIVVVIGIVAGAGFAGYQIGVRQSERISINADELPSVGRPNFDLERVPFAFDRGFERRFDRGFPHGGFRIMHRAGGGGFGLLRFFSQLAILGLLGLIAYLLFIRSGWRITRTEQTVQQTSPTTQTVTTVEEETKNES